jgi:hypothetical protein
MLSRRVKGRAKGPDRRTAEGNAYARMASQVSKYEMLNDPRVNARKRVFGRGYRATARGRTEWWLSGR